MQHPLGNKTNKILFHIHSSILQDVTSFGKHSKKNPGGERDGKKNTMELNIGTTLVKQNGSEENILVVTVLDAVVTNRRCAHPAEGKSGVGLLAGVASSS